ncbi:MAG: hypothetical protein GY953_35270, partial [bacterium]|nr:hypothetical protein [bacterium]
MKILFVHLSAVAALMVCVSGLASSGQAAEPVRWVKLTFALDGKAATWDGRVSAVGARIQDLQAWGFEAHHKLDKVARSWTCDSGLPPADVWKRSGNSFAEPYRGVLVAVAGGTKTRLQVTTA